MTFLHIHFGFPLSSYHENVWLVYIYILRMHLSLRIVLPWEFLSLAPFARRNCISFGGIAQWKGLSLVKNNILTWTNYHFVPSLTNGLFKAPEPATTPILLSWKAEVKLFTRKEGPEAGPAKKSNLGKEELVIRRRCLDHSLRFLTFWVLFLCPLDYSCWKVQ